MLWKVVDFVLTTTKRAGDETASSSILDVMMIRLLGLSIDSRPEIRNCALNTLFSAIIANSSLLSPDQWRRFYEDVLFPLFRKAEERSGLAMRSKEDAIAPEVKKGVKMTVHHSRDTAHKQWSESRVLALRGLTRIVKTSKSLMTQVWFNSVWETALEICVSAIHAVSIDQEVSIVGIETIFAMLKVVSEHTYMTKVRAGKGMRIVDGALEDASKSRSSVDKQNVDADDFVLTEEFEKVRDGLWQKAWKAVVKSIFFLTPSVDLPLHISQNLKELYVGGIESEFCRSENLRKLLEMTISVARPRFLADSVQSYVSSQKKYLSAAEIQLQRGIMSLFHSIRPVDEASFGYLVSSVVQICFANSFCLAHRDNDDEILLLGPIDDKLRSDTGEFLLQILKKSTALQKSQKSPPTLDESSFVSFPSPVESLHNSFKMILEHFIEGFCLEAIQGRRVYYNSIASVEHNQSVDISLRPRRQCGEWSLEIVSIPMVLEFTGESLVQLKSTERDWIPFPLSLSDLKLFALSIQECLHSTSGSEISNTLWSNVMTTLSCIFSPWNKNEICCPQITTPDFAQILNYCELLICSLVDFCIGKRLNFYSLFLNIFLLLILFNFSFSIQDSLSISLVDMISKVSSMLIYVLCFENSMSSENESGYYTSLLIFFECQLRRLYSCVQMSNAVRKRSNDFLFPSLFLIKFSFFF